MNQSRIQKKISFELYRSGKGIAEIAKERNFAISTIEGHLAYFVGTGDLSIDEMVSKDKQVLIHDAVAKHGHLSLTTLINNLPKEISYNEIRMALAANKITV